MSLTALAATVFRSPAGMVLRTTMSRVTPSEPMKQ
jgi:hypothetical protein